VNAVRHELRVKSFLLNTLAHETFLRIAASLGGGRGTIFVGHRFADADHGTPGHEPAILRRHLELLRRHRFNIVPLADLVYHLRDGRPLARRTVAFTVDDGYADFAAVAAPIFEAYDCPVTVFLTTGFMDREVWMWWDQISHVVLGTERRDVDLELGAVRLRERWTSIAERAGAAERIAEALKRVPEDEKWRAIARLAAALAVSIPEKAPPEYAPMTWDAVRACERGVTAFAPHTVTHPILNRVDSARARYEIAHSWDRVRQMVTSPVPVFCYPNGKPEDFSEQHAAMAREAGLEAAVTTVPQYVRTSEYPGGEPRRLFHIPRFGYPEPGDELRNERGFRHIVGGVERGKGWWRRIVSGRGATARANDQGSS
jgi:peptidoglycan/xylan/chitin deacetylase (PgdA/CDA1 family)